MIAQIVVFSCKTDAQRQKNFAFRSAKIAQKFCEWKPYCRKYIVKYGGKNYLVNYEDSENGDEDKNVSYEEHAQDGRVSDNLAE